MDLDLDPSVAFTLAYLIIIHVSVVVLPAELVSDITVKSKVKRYQSIVCLITLGDSASLELSVVQHVHLRVGGSRLVVDLRSENVVTRWLAFKNFIVRVKIGT